MAERRGIMCGCFWSQSTGWRINFFCSVTHSGRAVGYDAGQTRSWFARIDFYIRFLFSLMTSLFHNINRTWSRRRVSRGESNGSARLLDWSAPYSSSRVLVLPPHFPLMDTQTDVFFSSYQISWPFVLTSSAAQHSPRQSVLSSFLRPFHPIILFDGTSGRMLCDRSGPSLRQRSRANKRSRPANEKHFFLTDRYSAGFRRHLSGVSKRFEQIEIPYMRIAVRVLAPLGSGGSPPAPTKTEIQSAT